MANSSRRSRSVCIATLWVLSAVLAATYMAMQYVKPSGIKPPSPSPKSTTESGTELRSMAAGMSSENVTFQPQSRSASEKATSGALVGSMTAALLAGAMVLTSWWSSPQLHVAYQAPDIEQAVQNVAQPRAKTNGEYVIEDAKSRIAAGQAQFAAVQTAASARLAEGQAQVAAAQTSAGAKLGSGIGSMESILGSVWAGVAEELDGAAEKVGLFAETVTRKMQGQVADLDRNLHTQMARCQDAALSAKDKTTREMDRIQLLQAKLESTSSSLQTKLESTNKSLEAALESTNNQLQAKLESTNAAALKMADNLAESIADVKRQAAAAGTSFAMRIEQEPNLQKTVAGLGAAALAAGAASALAQQASRPQPKVSQPPRGLVAEAAPAATIEAHPEVAAPAAVPMVAVEASLSQRRAFEMALQDATKAARFTLVIEEAVTTPAAEETPASSAMPASAGPAEVVTAAAPRELTAKEKAAKQREELRDLLLTSKPSRR